MDPTALCCPHLACPARGQRGEGPRRRHARTARRCLGIVCPKTFSITKGTGFSRRRTAAETVRVGGTRLAHGCPFQAIVVAFGFDERTVAAWGARAGRQGQGVHAQLVEQPRALGPGPAAERRVKQPGDIGWMALALLVQPRWW